MPTRIHLAVHVVNDHEESTEKLTAAAALAAKHINSVQWFPHVLPLSVCLSLKVGLRRAANINNTPAPRPRVSLLTCRRALR